MNIHELATGTPAPSLTERWSAVMMNNYATPSLGLVSGDGSWVTGEDGTRYLDFLSGIAVSSLGHAPPRVVAAVREQIATLGHVSNLFAHPQGLSVAERLVAAFRTAGPEAVPDNVPVRVLFTNSGAESNEAAFKLARLTGRSRILATHEGFHGRTMGALALTGQPDKQKPFEPLPGGVEFFPYGDSEALHDLIAQNPEDVAAVIVEPIQGEAGVVVPPESFLEEARRLTRDCGALLIVDEVQTGMGRTGEWFLSRTRVVPDIITLAKGLAAGLPAGAVIACGSSATAFTPGAHGSTFAGNPVSLAAASVVLDELDAGLAERVRQAGRTLSEAVTHRGGEYVSAVRGAGLLLGVVLKEPIAANVVAAARERGLLLNAPRPTILRLTPPLTVSDDECATAVDILLDAFAAVSRVSAPTQQGDQS